MADSKPIAVIAGAGPGVGAALARRFAAGGYAVALLARDRDKLSALAAGIEGARAYACDVSDPASVTAAFDAIRAEMGEVDALLYNADSRTFVGIEEVTPEEFERNWRVSAFGSLLCSQAVIPAMKARGYGAILFTGATASLKGGPKSAAFAPAKAAQRGLAQSMARTLWPAGIHVGMVIIDGVVDMDRTRQSMPDKPDDFFVSPAGIADAVWHLADQDRRAWTFEVEVRPLGETW